jgi:hypothetical protein
MAPEAVCGVRIISLSWSPVTESNRRPSPYHGPTSSFSRPGTAPDQDIRWHTPAQASLNQRRRAPFCLSKCPSGSALSDRPYRSLAGSVAYSSTPIKVRVEMRERKASAMHLTSGVTSDYLSRNRQELSPQAQRSRDGCRGAWPAADREQAVRAVAAARAQGAQEVDGAHRHLPEMAATLAAGNRRDHMLGGYSVIARSTARATAGGRGAGGATRAPRGSPPVRS